MIMVSEYYYKMWEEIKVEGRMIDPRSYHSSALVNNTLYVYGGYEIHNGILDDFHCFDLASRVWTELRSIGPRRRHTLSAYEKDVYLFGGQITRLTSVYLCE